MAPAVQMVSAWESIVEPQEQVTSAVQLEVSPAAHTRATLLVEPEVEQRTQEVDLEVNTPQGLTQDLMLVELVHPHTPEVQDTPEVSVVQEVDIVLKVEHPTQEHPKEVNTPQVLMPLVELVQVNTPEVQVTLEALEVSVDQEADILLEVEQPTQEVDLEVNTPQELTQDLM